MSNKSSYLKFLLFSSNFFLILIPSSTKKIKNFLVKIKSFIKIEKTKNLVSKKVIKLLKSFTFS